MSRAESAHSVGSAPDRSIEEVGTAQMKVLHPQIESGLAAARIKRRVLLTIEQLQLA